MLQEVRMAPVLDAISLHRAGRFEERGEDGLIDRRRASPNRGRGSRCVAQAGRGSVRRGQRQSGRLPPVPSALGGEANHIAQNMCVGVFSMRARRVILWSVIGGSSVVFVSTTQLDRANRR